MKAIIIKGQTQIEDLQFEEVPVPPLQPDEVLVKVKAAGINPIDWSAPVYNLFELLNISLPYTMGNDISGIVEQVGTSVTKFEVGDEVIGALSLKKQGSFADYAAVSESLIVLKPKYLSFAVAAAVPLASQTALQGLFDYLHLEQGQKVLIQAAAGGVGTYAVQLARLAGAHVTAVGSEGNAEFLRSIGADEVFDYSNDYATLKNDFDAVFDSMASSEQTIPLLKRGGRYVSITDPASPGLAASHGVTASSFLFTSNARHLEDIVGLIGDEKLKVFLDKVFPMGDVVAALQYQRAGHSRGKNVLIAD